MRLQVTAVLLFLLPGSISPLVVRSQATPVRVADSQCSSCHTEIFHKYLATPMANASGLAVEKIHPARFIHQPSKVEYSISLQNSGATLSYKSEGGASPSVELPLNYFLGSGHLGTTYLYSRGQFLFESPIAWYPASQAYDMKPGLAEMKEMPPPLPMQSECLRCHMSAVQKSDRGTINRYQGLPFLHTGITCESCHGDSQKHLDSKGKAAIVNPARLTAELRDSVCINCHLEGDVSVERAGNSALDYRPGQPISKYISYYVNAGAKLTARGVSEVEQLNQSVCKRMSGDKMSCTSCHDPHFTPNEEQRAAFYRGKCLKCHSDPTFASNHHPENQDCTSCHLPRNGAANIVHVAWTDHRILRERESNAASPKEEKGVTLTPIFSPNATDRDLAMAYYQALLEGDRSSEAAAWKSLRALQSGIAEDNAALDALGVLSAERGDKVVAQKSFEQVLKLDSEDLTAESNLGILLARQGNLKEAIPLLQAAFNRNQDIAGLAMNLARVECMSGDSTAAQNTLKSALVYCPECEDMRRLLAELTSCKGTDAK